MVMGQSHLMAVQHHFKMTQLYHCACHCSIIPIASPRWELTSADFIIRYDDEAPRERLLGLYPDWLQNGAIKAKVLFFLIFIWSAPMKKFKFFWTDLCQGWREPNWTDRRY